MSAEELWQLFPIRLEPHKACWSAWFEEEKAVLLAVLPDHLKPCVHHIGSTAVPGIMAKPTVDILVETVDARAVLEAEEVLAAAGYLRMYSEPQRAGLNKGYTEDGFAERVFHVHLRVSGDAGEILFRDYLLSHPDAAKEYEQLKLSLWKKFEHDRDGYTEAKTDFVLCCMRRARKENASGIFPDGNE